MNAIKLEVLTQIDRYLDITVKYIERQTENERDGLLDKQTDIKTYRKKISRQTQRRTNKH